MKYFYRFISAIILIVAASTIFFAVWWSFASSYNTTGKMLGIGNLGMSMSIYTILFIILARWLKAFKIGVERYSTISAGIILGLFLTDFSEVLISMAISGHFVKYTWYFTWRYFLMWLFQSLVLCILAYCLLSLYRKLFPPFKLLEIYGDYPNDLTDKINGLAYKYHIKKSISYHIEDNELRKMMADYDAVVIGDVPADEKNSIIKLCLEEGKRAYFIPKISDIIVRSAEELNLFDTPLFLNRNIGMRKGNAFVKRLMDIIISLVALILFSPLFLIVSILIKLEDGGPVFFRQERCTIGGKRFMILKFRSMIVDAEKDGKPIPAKEKDPRITKIGSFIRATRIDEFPQLINILKGDMSIVGPRPERVEHVEKYTKEIPEFVLRHMVKGGLTGYAQVYGKYNTKPLDKLKLDLIYIMNYSLLMDLQIILETVRVIFMKESTEGFS